MKLVSLLVPVVWSSLIPVSPVGVDTRLSPAQFDSNGIMTKDPEFENTRFGVYRLGALLFETTDSLVFFLNRIDVGKHVTDPAHIVGKYSTDCRSGASDLAKEYDIMLQLNDLRITPVAYDLSPPSIVGDCVRNKVMTKYVRDFYFKCFKANVRLLTMELIGEVVEVRVEEWLNKDYDLMRHFNRVLQVGIATMQLLKILHSAGYVHGDIHGGNVAVREPGSWDLGELMLIDLGDAGHIGSPKHNYQAMNPLLASPWNWETTVLEIRDDIYRAVQMVVNLIGSNEYQNRLGRAFRRSRSSAAFATIKTELAFFDGQEDVFKPFTSERVGSIIGEFDTLQHYLLFTPVPNHELVIAVFRSLIQ